jgi:hypothetical protein
VAPCQTVWRIRFFVAVSITCSAGRHEAASSASRQCKEADWCSSRHVCRRCRRDSAQCRPAIVSPALYRVSGWPTIVAVLHVASGPLSSPPTSLQSSKDSGHHSEDDAPLTRTSRTTQVVVVQSPASPRLSLRRDRGSSDSEEESESTLPGLRRRDSVSAWDHGSSGTSGRARTRSMSVCDPDALERLVFYEDR